MWLHAPCSPEWPRVNYIPKMIRKWLVNVYSYVILVGLKKIEDSKTDKDSNQAIFENNGSNIIFDEPIKSKEDTPIYYVDNVSKILPIGSLCKVFLEMNEHTNELNANLRAETRFEINTEKYENRNGPLMYVSGRNIKN